MVVHSSLGVVNITTTEFHPRINREAERCKSTLMSRFHHYVSEHQPDWGTYFLPLTYAYNVQTQGIAFQLEAYANPPGPATLVPKSTDLATDDDVASPMYVRPERI